MSNPEHAGGHAHAQSRDTHEATTAGPGASVNRISIRLDANALSIIALMIAVAAFVIVIAQAVMQPQIIDAKIQAGAADAKAVAAAAKTDARVALDKVEDLRPKLAAQGIKIGPLDGH